MPAEAGDRVADSGCPGPEFSARNFWFRMEAVPKVGAQE